LQAGGWRTAGKLACRRTAKGIICRPMEVFDRGEGDMHKLLAWGGIGLIAMIAVSPAEVSAQGVAVVPDGGFDLASRARLRELMALEPRQVEALERARVSLEAVEETAALARIGNEVNLLGLELAVEEANLRDRDARAKVQAADEAYAAILSSPDLAPDDSRLAAALDVRLDAIGEASRAKRDLEVAISRLGLRRNPLDDNLARIASAQRVYDRLAGELSATQTELVQLIPQYLAAVLVNPPPFVERIEVSSGGKAIYVAQWEPQKGPVTPLPKNVLQAQGLVIERIGTLQQAIADERVLRLSLVPRLETLQPRFNDLVDDAAEYRYWGTVVTTGIDALGTLVGAFATGGASTLPALWDGLSRTNLKGGQIPQVLVGKGGSNFLAKVVATAVDKYKPADPTYGTTLTNTALAGGQVVLGDTIESLLGAAISPEAVITGLGERVGPGVANYAKTLKDGLLVSALTSIAKTGVTAYTEYLAGEAERELAEVALDMGGALVALRGSRDRERAMREELRDKMIALNRITYLLGAQDKTFVLNRQRDDVIALADLQRGMAITLSFPSTVSRPPVVTVPGGRVLDWDQQDGLGKVWRGTVPPARSATAVPERYPLTISLDPASQPYSRLDGLPESPARLNGPQLRWSGIDAVADTKHVLRGQNVDGGLSGVWGFYAEFLVEQNGEDVTIRFRRRDPIIAIEAGALYFEGKLTAQNQLVGRRTWYPPRSRGCAAGGMTLPAQWTVNRNATGRATTLQGAMPEGVFNIECRFSANDYTDRPTIHRDLRSNTIRE
jgi:hypothetical protein